MSGADKGGRAAKTFSLLHDVPDAGAFCKL